MHTVYIDASSAILLYKAGLFIPCTRYFSMIMEEEVYKEVRVPDHPGADFFLSMIQKKCVKVCRVDPGRRKITLPENLDPGERQTLMLYFQNVHPDGPLFIIMDDAKGAKFCMTRKVPFINALLVPKILWFAGRLDKTIYLEKTDAIIQTGRYSRAVIEKAKGLSRTDLDMFIPYEK